MAVVVVNRVGLCEEYVIRQWWRDASKTHRIYNQQSAKCKKYPK